MSGDLNTRPTTIEEAMAREYPPACSAPCSQCPWRRAAAAGWLGPHTADEWIAAAHGDGAIACHLTIPASDGWGPNTKQCAGAAAFRANVCKSPRNPTIADWPPREDVFASNQEFINHHEGERKMSVSEQIEKVKQATGWVDEDADRAVEEHDGWHYGERVRVIESDDDRGLVEGDQGFLILTRVGAAEHNNERVAMSILVDEFDSTYEVTPDDIEPA